MQNKKLIISEQGLSFDSFVELQVSMGSSAVHVRRVPRQISSNCEQADALASFDANCHT